MADEQKKSRPGSFPLLQVLLTIPFALLAFMMGHRDRSPAPCGTPLPPIPQLVQNTGDNFEGVSVAKGRIPQAYLQFLAPQPDGTVPLRYPFDCVRSDFHMRLPMGATNLPMGDDTFYEDGIDAQIVFSFEQQLDYIKVSIPPRQAEESVIEFCARARHDYEQLGANFYPEDEQLRVNGMIWQHFEYDRLTEEKENQPKRLVSHFIYVAPAGYRVTILDFMTTPERHEAARPLVNKILASIQAGPRFLEQMQLEYPAELGDGASQPESEQPAPEAEPDPPQDSTGHAG